MKACVILLLIAGLVALLQCQEQLQKVVKFCPSTKRMHASPAMIKAPNQTWDILTSWSVCLRFNILRWSPNLRLLEIVNFQLLLESISSQNGQVFYKGPVDLFFQFDLKDVLSFSLRSWNSACMTYSPATEHLAVVINGQVLLSTALDMQFLPKFSNFSYVTAGFSGFVGSVTDLNVWSKPLSLQDMDDFSRGNILLNKTTPDIVHWQTALVLPRFNQCLNVTTIDPKIIEQNNAHFHSVEIFAFEPTAEVVSFAASQSDCHRINGKVFYPMNWDQLYWMVKTFGHILDATFCEKTFWIPFQKRLLPNGSYEWWLVEGPQTKKAEFGPWSLNTSQSDGDCLHFDLSNKQYVQRKCVEDFNFICLLCQLERNRLIFKLQSECLPDWKNHVDQFYFLSDEEPAEGLRHISLIGETALTDFVYTTDTKMLQRVLSESHIFEFKCFILVL